MGNTSSFPCEGEHCLLSSPNSKCLSKTDDKDQLNVAVKTTSECGDKKAHDLLANAISRIKKEIEEKKAKDAEESAKDALFRTNFDKQIKQELEVNPVLAEKIEDTFVKGTVNVMGENKFSRSLQTFIQTRPINACTTIEDVVVCLDEHRGYRYINTTLKKLNKTHYF